MANLNPICDFLGDTLKTQILMLLVYFTSGRINRLAARHLFNCLQDRPVLPVLNTTESDTLQYTIYNFRIGITGIVQDRTHHSPSSPQQKNETTFKVD